jgi:hypothetical protein
MLNSIQTLLHPTAKQAIFAIVFLLFSTRMWAVAGGSISGMVTESTKIVIPAEKLLLVNQAQQTRYRATSNAQGGCTFLNVPVDEYSITASVTGFAAKKIKDLAVDKDANLRVDVVLAIGHASDTVSADQDLPAHASAGRQGCSGSPPPIGSRCLLCHSRPSAEEFHSW